MVVRAGLTRKKAIARSFELLSRFKIRILGAIINDIDLEHGELLHLFGSEAMVTSIMQTKDKDSLMVTATKTRVNQIRAIAWCVCMMIELGGDASHKLLTHQGMRPHSAVPASPLCGSLLEISFR